MKAKESNKDIVTQVQAEVKSNAEKIAESAQAESIVNTTAKAAMREYINNGNSDTFGKQLQTLAMILAQCKLRNLYNDDAKGREEFRIFKAQICNYRSQQTSRDALNSLYEWDTDSNSYICIDKRLEGDIVKAMRERNDNTGGDLVQECILTLLEVVKTAEKKGTLSETTILDVFTTYDLRSMYYTDGAQKPAEKWKEKASNGIKEGSLAISRLIDRERAIREQTALYSEIVTVCINGDGEEVGMFITYKKASTLSATDVTDANGKTATTIVDDQTNNLFTTIPERANFSKNERYVFFHHYDLHESFEQIADKLKVSVKAVESYDQRLKAKIVKANIFPQFNAGDRGGIVKAEKAIRCFSADDETQTTIATFGSVREASRVLNIDASLISKVLKGKRQTAGSLKFEYINK